MDQLIQCVIELKGVKSLLKFPAVIQIIFSCRYLKGTAKFLAVVKLFTDWIRVNVGVRKRLSELRGVLVHKESQ